MIQYKIIVKLKYDTINKPKTIIELTSGRVEIIRTQQQLKNNHFHWFQDDFQFDEIQRNISKLKNSTRKIQHEN